MTDQERAKFLAEFGNRVKTLRIKREMTLEELAKKIGYTTDNARSSVQKIEAGKSDPPASRIHNLATELDVPVAVLMGWEEFDKQIDVEKLEAETAMWDFIGKHYGEKAVETLNQYLAFSPKDQEKISKIGRAHV